MEKRKRDPVVPEMRERLLANRDGRITPGQWLDLIIQPLLILGVLIAAALAVFGKGMMVMFVEVWWIVVPVIFLLVIVPVSFRAYRYARAPVHFARLYAGVQPWWGFWKPTIFYTAADEPVRFPRRLAPRLPMRINGEYLVYFLEEPQGKVLLSAAPADHEDAELWLPTRNFEVRRARRSGHR